MVASIRDYELAQYDTKFRVTANASAALATATKAAPSTNQRLFLVTVDASYATSTQSGLLQVKSGTTVIAEKFIHGAGALDFHEKGTPAINLAEAMSAELQAGAGVGNVTINGFTVTEKN